VLSGAQKDQWFYKEKVFDPILLTTPFDADEDAFVLSNGTDYSLTA
jgi:acyl-CoA reductase-like NAD-dependent aldehyde dehydrogenase